MERTKRIESAERVSFAWELRTGRTVSVQFAERKERFVLVKVFRLEQKVCRQPVISSLGKK
jgi:hypothetical protein